MSSSPLSPSFRQSRLASFAALFSSGGTLICCALPALLVTLGAGAALSSLISAVPQLVWFSEHKEAVFAFATVMLLASSLLQWRARYLPCPADPQLAASCTRTRRRALQVHLLSVALYLLGAYFAFIAPWLAA